MEEVEDSPDFWSGPVQSYNSPVEQRFLIGLDRSTNGPLPDCDRKYVSVRTMPPGIIPLNGIGNINFCKCIVQKLGGYLWLKSKLVNCQV